MLLYSLKEHISHSFAIAQKLDIFLRMGRQESGEEYRDMWCLRRPWFFNIVFHTTRRVLRVISATACVPEAFFQS